MKSSYFDEDQLKTLCTMKKQFLESLKKQPFVVFVEFSPENKVKNEFQDHIWIPREMVHRTAPNMMLLTLKSSKYSEPQSPTVLKNR